MADLPPARLRSITWDQGTEMARHLTIARRSAVTGDSRPVGSGWERRSRPPWPEGRTEGLIADDAAAAELIGGLLGAVARDEAPWDRGDVRASAAGSP